jgi:hypothetical protein
MYSCKEILKERKDYIRINLYARHNNIIIDFGAKKQPKAWRTLYIYMIALIYIEHWYLLATNIILHIDKHKIIFFLYFMYICFSYYCKCISKEIEFQWYISKILTVKHNQSNVCVMFATRVV